MGISKARHRANEKYNAKAYDEIKVRVVKGRKAELQAFVARHGLSVNGFINSLIDESLEREQDRASPADSPAIEGGRGGYGISSDNPADILYSQLMSQSGHDFQTALSHSGQSPEEFIAQAVRERVEREQANTSHANHPATANET